MTSASSASVAPSSPALAPLVWSTPCTRSARLVNPLHSLRSFAQAPHSLRSFGQSLRSTVRAIAVMRSAKADPPPAAPCRLFVVPPTSGHLALLPSLRSGLRPSPRCRATSLRSPKRKHLHVTRCTRLSRLLHLRLRRFPPVNVLARTSHAVSFWSTATPVHSLGQSRSATDTCN